MKQNKYLAQLIAFNIFRFSLYALVTVIALCVIFARPTGIKQAFLKTRAYERFVPLTIDAAAKINQNSGSAPINDPAIQQIIKDSFPNAKLQAETEKVIDASYAWLNGQTPGVYFRVDFSQNIEQMAARLSEYGITRLKSQPPCDYYPQSVDPFTSTCRPQKFDYSAEQKALKDEIIKNNGIIQKTIITADDLPKSGDGKTLVQKYSYAPRIFKLILYSLYILFGLSVASAIVVIYLDRRKRDAVYRIGTNIVTANVFLILSPIVYFYILPYFFPSMNIGSSYGGGAAVLGDVINKLTLDFSNWLVIVGSVFAVVGIFIILLERFTRPKSKYVNVDKKAGLTSSEKPRNKRSGKAVLNELTVPIQTSEGKRPVAKYQKNKKYRKIAKKEFR